MSFIKSEHSYNEIHDKHGIVDEIPAARGCSAIDKRIAQATAERMKKKSRKARVNQSTACRAKTLKPTLPKFSFDE